MTKNSTAGVLLLYTMSGFSGLLAEQALEKYAALLVGVTASASAVVLFTYFLGFAAGGYGAARLLRRGMLRRSLRVYGLVELGVGIGCVVYSYAFHPAMGVLAPLQGLVPGTLAREAVRFAYGCVLILPIAALMGASFPLIAQSLDSAGGSAARQWSVAYSYNLAGAVLASLLAPYLILPAIGLRGAMWLCCAICASIGLAVQFLPEAVPGRGAAAGAPIERRRPGRADLLPLVVAFVSGLAFFALEVIWTHLIGTVVGGSVYAFSSMLAAVLIGLWCGAALVNCTGNSGGLPAWALLGCCAMALLIQLRAWDMAPVLFVRAGPAIYANFYTRELYRLLVALLLIVPPATLLGMIYPRVLRDAGGRGGDRNGWLAGYLSTANALGCLLGALGATFVFVPWWGSEASLKGIVITFVMLAMLFVAREAAQPRAARMAAAGILAVFAVAAAVVRWDWPHLTSGVPMYFGEVFRATGEGSTGPVTRSLIFRDEDIQGGFTTVVDEVPAPGSSAPTIRSMYTNGKLQGNDSMHGEFGLNFGIAFIPAMFVGRFDRALLIGLGTGQTASLLKTAGFRDVDIAEFSPGIVRAASGYFAHINHSVLEDPSVRVIPEDGRNLLLVDSRGSYSLITVEITTIWFSGATNLYAREFYELARSRLEPDGILQQWVQLHRIGPDSISSAIAAARAVFPYVAYWNYGGQGMIIAGNRPLAAGPERMAYLAKRLGDCPDIPPARQSRIMDEIPRAELLSAEGVDEMLAYNRPVINTDHNRYIEYDTPRYSSSSRDWRAFNIAFLGSWNRRRQAQ
jgi:spermidine synthase